MVTWESNQEKVVVKSIALGKNGIVTLGKGNGQHWPAMLANYKRRNRRKDSKVSVDAISKEKRRLYTPPPFGVCHSLRIHGGITVWLAHFRAGSSNDYVLELSTVEEFQTEPKLDRL